MTDGEQELAGPIAGVWKFPFLSRAMEKETASIGQEGAVNRAMDRAPQVLIKHMSRAAGQTAADMVGNAAADSVGTRLSDLFGKGSLLRRRQLPPAEIPVEEVK